MALRETKGNIEPTHYGVGEAEAITGVSRWTWRSYAYSRKIESVKVGSRLLIPVAEIRRVIQEGTRRRRDGLAAGELSARTGRRAAIVRSSNIGQSAHA